MNWQNLRDFLCPYCGEKLIDNKKERRIDCTVCMWKMGMDKFRAILMHRAQKPSADYQKHFWQNVIDYRCPVCANDLRPEPGHLEILRCSSADCPFKSREDTIKAIIDNKDHIAWRFYKGKNEPTSTPTQ